ncbi:MAG TPA: carboxypeptidase-like regulatory domain-containing protein [Pyrinomonadaceae bacterium]|jgi:hypothetical protein
MKYKNSQLFDLIFFVVVVLVVLLFALSARAQSNQIQPSSGGGFTLEKQVVAGGGNQMQQASMQQAGTASQTIAGYKSSGGNFSLYSGFWTPETFAPTAANVVVGGQIKTADGRGIKNVLVTVAFPSGQTRTALSSAFGYYRFADIPAGELYIFSVAAKRFTFAQPSQARQISDDTQDIDFIADASNFSEPQ